MSGLKKLVITVWKNGEWKLWGAVDAHYAKADEDFLANIGLLEVLNYKETEEDELAVKHDAPALAV